MEYLNLDTNEYIGGFLQNEYISIVLILFLIIFLNQNLLNLPEFMSKLIKNPILFLLAIFVILRISSNNRQICSISIISTIILLLFYSKIIKQNTNDDSIEIPISVSDNSDTEKNEYSEQFSPLSNEENEYSEQFSPLSNEENEYIPIPVGSKDYAVFDSDAEEAEQLMEDIEPSLVDMGLQMVEDIEPQLIYDELQVVTDDEPQMVTDDESQIVTGDESQMISDSIPLVIGDDKQMAIDSVLPYEVTDMRLGNLSNILPLVPSVQFQKDTKSDQQEIVSQHMPINSNMVNYYNKSNDYCI